MTKDEVDEYFKNCKLYNSHINDVTPLNKNKLCGSLLLNLAYLFGCFVLGVVLGHLFW